MTFAAGHFCMAELNIGHAIVSRAVFVGMRESVREMKQAIDQATQARDVQSAHPIADERKVLGYLRGKPNV